MRRLLFTLHLVVGIGAGLLLTLTGLTGSLLVFRHELDAALNPELLRVPARGEPAPVGRAVEAAVRAVPGARVQHLFVAPAPGAAHEVWLQGTERRVYVDPYTARVLGTRDERRSVMGRLFALHTKLLGGESRERVVGFGGLALLFLSASGLVLWWPSRLRQLPDRLRVKWGASAKRVNYDLHRSVGFWAAGLLALTALTGSSLVFSEWFTAAAYRLTRTHEPPKVRVNAPPDGGAGAPLPLDALLRRADAALPGGDLRRVSFPAKPDAPLVIRKRLPGDLHPNGMSYVYLDPYTGDVLRADAAGDAVAGRRLLNLRYPLHIGRWGGLATRVLYVLLGLLPGLLFVTGCRMWWNRAGAKRRRNPPVVG